MQNPAATLYCSNLSCQALNQESHKFCQRCCTPLSKLYLWAVGEGIEAYKAGDLIAERYLLKSHRVLLDTKPGLSPETPEEIPSGLQPYLKLSAHQLHIPQVYGRIQLTTGRHHTELWLLEQGAISTGSLQAPESEGQLMPELTAVWKEATPLRQLNWLWQIAQLWEPMNHQGVASSLLTPALLRTNGSIIRLLMLQMDQKQPTLQQLGQLWSQWAATAQPAVANFIKQVGAQLQQGQVQNSDHLVALLDWGLEAVGRAQSRTLKIVTRTDQGPSRQQNEDACYPEASAGVQLYKFDGNASQPKPLAIVCDGIGGHEGGEVASSLAIDSVRHNIQNLRVENLQPSSLSVELENAVCAANDRISQRNDNELRFDRQRMGTTLVMALAKPHELYITHVGDSRAYWITRTGCYQVTLDDDVASREVRLGYALYRNAVQQVSAGSLVQALGMGSSAVLRPTVQRFILDEDCVFLLCSDGLSDNDRVEQYWESEILPVLEGQVDVASVAKRLVEIANTQNGHDNVTVALVYTQVKPDTYQTAEISLPQLETIPAVSPARATDPYDSASSRLKTQLIAPRRSSGNPIFGLLVVILFLGLSGLLAYLLLPELRNRVNPLIGLTPSPSPSTTAEPPLASSPASPAVPIPSPTSALKLGGLIQITNNITQNAEGKEIPLLLRRGFTPPQSESVIGQVSATSILQVLPNPPESSADRWVQVKVCTAPRLAKSPLQQPTPNPARTPQGVIGQPAPVSNPRTPSVTYGQVEPGKSGWVRESELVLVMRENFTTSPAVNLGACGQAPISPTPTVTPTS